MVCLQRRPAQLALCVVAVLISYIVSLALLSAHLGFALCVATAVPRLLIDFLSALDCVERVAPRGDLDCVSFDLFV